MNKTMGEIISERRKAKNMTQADLAAKMNITDKAVSKWERNLSCPDIHSVSTLAEALDISVNELLNAKSEKPPKSDLKETISVLLKAIPLAMGVAAVVLSALGKLDTTSGFTLLGLGLACLSVDALTNCNT